MRRDCNWVGWWVRAVLGFLLGPVTALALARVLPPSTPEHFSFGRYLLACALLGAGALSLFGYAAIYVFPGFIPSAQTDAADKPSHNGWSLLLSCLLIVAGIAGIMLTWPGFSLSRWLGSTS